MQVISGVNNSAFFAQSAYSAATATFDKNGNDIAETYYPASNPSAFITGVDLTPYQTTASMTGYLTTADSANFYTNDNPSGFITGVDLSNYATTAELAGKQEAGDYLSATESANYYPMTGNPSGFLTDVPAGTLNESKFEYDTNDKISGYNGSAFAGEGGGSVPEGVMAESGLEYNAVNEISGYNGSAIAQYGAEKQWLVHDDTLVHAANSAQYALGVNLSAVAQLLGGIDETVLWSGARTSAVETSESMKNFDKCQIYIAHGTYGPPQVYTIDFADMDTTGYFAIVRPRGASNFNLAGIRFTADATHIAAVNSKCISFNSWSNGQTAIDATYSEPEDLNSIIRVVGVGRKQ